MKNAQICVNSVMDQIKLRGEVNTFSWSISLISDKKNNSDETHEDSVFQASFKRILVVLAFL